MIRIAHISDTHATRESAFEPSIHELILNEINRSEFDCVVHTGDITNQGLKDEYEYATYLLKKINKPLVVLPGNHDARNVGYELFEKYVGPLNGVYERDNFVIIWVDSTIPDLSDGRIGKYRFEWLKEKLDEFSHKKFKIVASHHHLVPLPTTGRERNVLFNAGDVLDLLLRYEVNLYLCGHKHVPNVYCVEDLVIVNAGCASCRKTRKGDVNSYNIVKIRDDGRVHVIIRRVNGEEEEKEYAITGDRVFIPKGRRLLRIAHISESNVSDRVYFKKEALERAIEQINSKYKPDVLIHCGDVVDVGIERYYEIAEEYLEKIDAEKLIIPGHNDMTYLGHTLFKTYFGEVEIKEIGKFVIIPVVTAQYESTIGVVGKIGQECLMKHLEEYEDRFVVAAMHHNLMPVPKSREVGYLEDAGNVLKILTSKRAELVLTGHGSNAFSARIEKTPVVNAGSVSWELHRNPFGNSFNLIDVYEDWIVVFEVHAENGSKRILSVWKIDNC